MNQTSIDPNVRPDEATQQLTFRPVHHNIPDMRVELEPDGANWVRVRVFPHLFSAYRMEKVR